MRTKSDYYIYKPMRATMPATIGNNYIKEYGYRGNLYKISENVGNWDIYTDSEHVYMFSIAKPGTGCRCSQYGDIRHIRRMIREGHIKKSELTKLGRKLLRAEGMKI